MAQFEVGDRVVVRYIMKLTAIQEDGSLFFSWKENAAYGNYVVHPKQCRRLVKKKREEIRNHWDGTGSEQDELLAEIDELTNDLAMAFKAEDAKADYARELMGERDAFAPDAYGEYRQES